MDGRRQWSLSRKPNWSANVEPNSLQTETRNTETESEKQEKESSK